MIPIATCISCAQMPIASMVVKNSVFDTFFDDAAEHRQVAMYDGHPVAAAVELRNIEIMEAERLAEVGMYSSMG